MSTVVEVAAVLLNAEVQAVHGDTHLTAIDVRDASKAVSRRERGGLFVFGGLRKARPDVQAAPPGTSTPG